MDIIVNLDNGKIIVLSPKDEYYDHFYNGEFGEVYGVDENDRIIIEDMFSSSIKNGEVDGVKRMDDFSFNAFSVDLDI